MILHLSLSNHVQVTSQQNTNDYHIPNKCETMVMTDVTNLLSILQNEEEFIIKPFHPDTTQKLENAVEYGKIVSRMNRTLFDYQIGDKTNSSMIGSIFNQTVQLFDPDTKQVVLKLSYNRLPFLCKISSKKEVQCLTRSSNEFQSIGSIQQRLAFGKVWYDVFNSKHEHMITLMLRKSYLMSLIQHRMLEFEILDRDTITTIGRIYPFSTHLEGSHYGHAVAIKLPQDMTVEMKAILLIATLIFKSRLN